MPVHIHRAWRPRCPNRRKPSRPPTLSSDEESLEKFQGAISLSSLDSKEDSDDLTEPFSKRIKTEDISTSSGENYSESDEKDSYTLRQTSVPRKLSQELNDNKNCVSGDTSPQISRTQDSKQVTDGPSSKPIQKYPRIHLKGATSPKASTSRCTDAEQQIHALRTTGQTQVREQRISASRSTGPTQLLEPQTSASKNINPTQLQEPQASTSRSSDSTQLRGPQTSASMRTNPTQLRETPTSALRSTNLKQLREPQTSASRSTSPTQLQEPQTSASRSTSPTQLREPQTSASRSRSPTQLREPQTSASRCTGPTKPQKPQTSASSTDPTQLRESQTSAPRSGKQMPKRNRFGETPLQEACKKGDLDTVRELRQQGHSVNVQDEVGWTPLHEASGYELTKYLLDEGADIDHRGGPGCGGITPLMDAARHGLLDVVSLLLEYGANADIKDVKNKTALDHLLEWRKRQTKKNKKLDKEIERKFSATVAKLEESTTTGRGESMPSAQEEVMRALKEMGLSDADIEPVVLEYGKTCLLTVERFFQLKDEYEGKARLGEIRKRKATVRPQSDRQQRVECSSSVCKTVRSQSDRQQRVECSSSVCKTVRPQSDRQQSVECSSSVCKKKNRSASVSANKENEMVEHGNQQHLDRDSPTGSSYVATPLLRLKTDVSIQTEYEDLDIPFSSLQVVSPSAIVLINSQFRLALYNVKTMELVDQQTYSSPISDLTSCRENEVAVLLTAEKKLYVLSTANSCFSVQRKIKTDQEYNFLTGFGKRIVLCKARPPKLVLLDLEDKNWRTFYARRTLNMSNTITDIVVSPDGQCIVVLDESSVTNINWHGEEVAKYRSNEVHPPTFLQSLRDDSLLVCFTTVDKIERITRDCKKCQTLELENTELTCVKAMGYDIYFGRIYVVCADPESGTTSRIRTFDIR